MMFAYCPRLFHFMHVEGRFVDNQFTVEGRTAHRRVDQLDHVLTDADRAADKTTVAGEAEEGKSLFPRDNDEAAGDFAVGAARVRVTRHHGEARSGVIGWRRGRARRDQAWAGAGQSRAVVGAGERVQLMAQGLLLREAGYACDRGVLYFAASRTRVTVPFTPELEARTRELIALARAATDAIELPEPLEDSPKCKGCSLNSDLSAGRDARAEIRAGGLGEHRPDGGWPADPADVSRAR